MGKEYLRLDSKFNSVAAFWKPETPDEVMTGTLTVNDDGIRFVTSPEYFQGAKVPRPDPSQWNSDSIRRSDVLHGFFEGENCTLLNLMEVEHPGLTSYKDELQSVAATAHRASIFVGGMRTGAIDAKCLDSARYTFSSLSQFVNAPFTEKWGNGLITIEIQAEPKPLLDCSVLETRVHVELKACQTLTTDEEEEARLTKTVAIVEVTPPEAESLSWFMGIGSRLENLFSLLAGTSLVMETFFIYREDKSGAVIRKQHAFVEKYKMLDSLRHSNSQLAHAISTWLSESEGFREIENLLLGVLRKGKLFVETEFLSLAQALEGFHRATGGDESKMDKASFKVIRGKIEKFLEEQQVDDETAKKVNAAVAHCNQASFRSRLKELCGRISQSTLGEMKIDPDAFAASVMNTRNFFTHAGGSSDEKKEPLRGGELFLLSQKMRALLRGVFLLHLGFPEPQFKDLIVREATKWR
jgi:ApeA N-terminal domain 1